MKRHNSINNQKHLLSLRRILRKSLTPSEARLWFCLQKKQLDGKRFRRQFSVGNFILDFYCPKQKLAVELDGKHHFTPAGVMIDGERDAFLEAQGIAVLRFENNMVLMQLENVLETIRQHFSD
ncbi:MAG TPA: endonuclease domain-containing protein [Chitinophagaceae bacterium]|nr:endonuclease domain-containing protein [Chitinophagaceae bacterium]